MVDLVHCQKVVEEMLRDGRDLSDVEDYIEASALDQFSKAGLWMLAWAHQDPAAQLQLARETLALASALQSAATRSSARPPDDDSDVGFRADDGATP